MCKRLRYKKRKKTLHFEYLIILKHLPRYLSYELTKQFIGERSLFAYDTTYNTNLYTKWNKYMGKEESDRQIFL